jgi:HAD superfamily hydrolase (TIGR01509 family)
MKALIFDFDGLVLDTETTDFQSWEEIYWTFGVELPFEMWAKGVGASLQAFNPLDYLETLVGPVDRLKVKSTQKQRLLSLIDAQPLMPGVNHYLNQARTLGLKVAIASTSSQDWVTRHLSRHGLEERFDCIMTGDRVARVKPFPDVYLAALSDLKLESREAIAFEDSPNGIRAAKAAGLYCVAVPNPVTIKMDTSQADLVLNSLANMPLNEIILNRGE